jgi:hypothetical protein
MRSKNNLSLNINLNLTLDDKRNNDFTKIILRLTYMMSNRVKEENNDIERDSRQGDSGAGQAPHRPEALITRSEKEFYSPPPRPSPIREGVQGRNYFQLSL